jgi:hypothetical protein
MRPVLSAFVDAFSRPMAIAGLGAAQLAAWLALGLAVRTAGSAGLGGAMLAIAVTLVMGRAWRALALATALPRVVMGAWPAPARLIVRAARILALDVAEGVLVVSLGVAALVVISRVPLAQAAPLAVALGLAPILMLSMVGFATFRQATLEVAVAGAPAHLALGRAFQFVLARPRELLSVQTWLVLGLMPLGFAALMAGAMLPVALVGAAAVLWGYAALGRLRWAMA